MAQPPSDMISNFILQRRIENIDLSDLSCEEIRRRTLKVMELHIAFLERQRDPYGIIWLIRRAKGFFRND